MRAFFAAAMSGDPDAARAFWADDAVWHLTGAHEMARDYAPDDYLRILAEWNGAHPSYRATFREVRGYGDDLALFFLASTGGIAPGTATGLLIYRVVDDKIAEGWAISADSGGKYPF